MINKNILKIAKDYEKIDKNHINAFSHEWKKHKDGDWRTTPVTRKYSIECLTQYYVDRNVSIEECFSFYYDWNDIIPNCSTKNEKIEVKIYKKTEDILHVFQKTHVFMADDPDVIFYTRTDLFKNPEDGLNRKTRQTYMEIV